MLQSQHRNVRPVSRREQSQPTPLPESCAARRPTMRRSCCWPVRVAAIPAVTAVSAVRCGLATMTTRPRRRHRSAPARGIDELLSPSRSLLQHSQTRVRSHSICVMVLAEMSTKNITQTRAGRKRCRYRRWRSNAARTARSEAVVMLGSVPRPQRMLPLPSTVSRYATARASAPWPMACSA